MRYHSRGILISKTSIVRGAIVRSLISLSLAIGAAVLATFQTAHARVTKVTVIHTESPTFEGRSFGSVAAM